MYPTSKEYEQGEQIRSGTESMPIFGYFRRPHIRASRSNFCKSAISESACNKQLVISNHRLVILD